MKILRIICFALFAVLSVGFRTVNDRRWKVSLEEPTIWLDLDPKLYADDGFGDIVDKMKGELEVLKSLPLEQQRPEIWRLILADFDTVKTSFLRLRLKPGAIPDIDAKNTDPYDDLYSQTHTIKLVVGTSRGAASGFSSLQFDGSTIAGCEIVIAPRTLADPLFFKHVLTHEIMHCLGLNHQQEDTDSLMSYSNNSASISLEERMALTHLYPSDPAYANEKATFGMACTPEK